MFYLKVFANDIQNGRICPWYGKSMVEEGENAMFPTIPKIIFNVLITLILLSSNASSLD